MQFSTVAFLAAASVVSAVTVTETESTSTLVTITQCDSTVTDCPAASTTAADVSSSVVGNYSTPANISSAYEGAAARHYAVGGVALFAGALLAL